MDDEVECEEVVGNWTTGAGDTGDDTLEVLVLVVVVVVGIVLPFCCFDKASSQI